MNEHNFDGALYAAAVPDGECAGFYIDHVEFVAGERISTCPEGLVHAPAAGRVAGRFVLAGKGHNVGNAWLYNGDKWIDLGVEAYGANEGPPCVIFGGHVYVSAVGFVENVRVFDALTGALVGSFAADIGTEGISRVIPPTPDLPFGSVVPQRLLYGKFGFARFVELGDVRIGQSPLDDGGLWARIGDGPIKVLEPGPWQFIVGNESGGVFSIAASQFGLHRGALRWYDRHDIEAAPNWVPKPPPPPPPPPPPEKLMYRSQEQILPYLVQRWSELGVPAAVDAVKRQVGIFTDNEMTDLRVRGENGDEAARQKHDDAEAKFRAVETAAFFRAVGELYWQKGFKDVGLGRKTGGANVAGKATDIVVLKPIDAAGHAIDGQVKQYDAMNSNGYPEARPGWGEIPFNSDRTWVEPENLGGDPAKPGPVTPPSSSFAAAASELEARIADLARTVQEQRKMIDALAAKTGENKSISLTGKRIALRTDNGHYLCAEGGGSGEVNATRPSAGGWETFTLEEQ